jgi:hypothetical protein
MIIILTCTDLQRVYADIEASMVGVHHLGLKDEVVAKVKLVVYIDNSKVYVLKGTKWLYGKPMSAADLIQYIGLGCRGQRLCTYQGKNAGTSRPL